MEIHGDLPFPDTALATAATRFARDIEGPAIFNHSIRTYLYGRFLGEQRGWRPDEDYDDELLFLGCVLHDVGLSEEGNGDQRFDVDGADLAARFLTERGVAADRVEVVWDAIALHLTFEVAQRKRPEIALVTAGAGYDLTPDAEHPLPAGYAERVHRVLPRLGGAVELRNAVVAQALANPLKAPPYSLPAELVRQETGRPWPTWEQLMGQEPSWHDYDPRN
ncbi:HD domain-containing protein [Saccharothrix algeriensis]|uniref:HD domain-containing protein n=1 Tax=Saccharothrix algeriensis TaxID=173560 RepID=A0A8T8I0A4_9PSEU|nr:HD domain-containing protein [Saccharothrix algeriensis]MBM7815175.1 hypothetical protein [Saccharothrix algeriensis]QTR03414.1 HD domain-containing protein [Saccharothrix algeriensis]